MYPLRAPALPGNSPAGQQDAAALPSPNTSSPSGLPSSTDPHLAVRHVGLIVRQSCYRKLTRLRRLDHEKIIREAWESQVDKLSKADIARFKQHEQQGLDAYIAKISQACEDQKRRSRAMRINDWFQPIFRTVSLLMPLANLASTAASSVYPNPSSLILSGITCVMEQSARFSGYPARISKALSVFGRQLQNLADYQESVFHYDDKIELALIKLYGCILDFCTRASKLFLRDDGTPRSSVRMACLSVSKTFDDDLGEVVTAFQQELKTVEERAQFQSRLLAEQEREQAAIARSQDQAHRQRQDQLQIQGLAQLNTITSGVMALDLGMRQYVAQQESWRELELVLRERAESARKRKVVCAWIPTTQYHARYADICDQHLEGTGQWLLSRTEYEAWKEDEKSALLWVKGKHGCGKSFLAAMVISDVTLEAELGRVGVAYVFCHDASEKRAREPVRLACTVLRQLMDDFPVTAEVEKLYENGVIGKDSLPEWHLVVRALESVVRQFADIYIVVDGLDECSEPEGAKLVEFLNTLLRLDSTSVKIIVFSRPGYNHLERALNAHVQLPIDEGANDGDIEVYISSIIAENRIAVGNYNELIPEIRNKLLTNADGMFLWVFLMKEHLFKQETPNDVAAALATVPSSLDAVFALAVGRVADHSEPSTRQRALKIIRFALEANRPLSRDEMFVAIAVQPGQRYLDIRDVVPTSHAHSWPARCADLVRVNRNGHFVLLHSSFRECFHRWQEQGPEASRDLRNIYRYAPSSLAKICLTYLVLDDVSEAPCTTKEALTQFKTQYPLLWYSVSYLHIHIERDSDTSIYDLALRVVNKASTRDYCLQMKLALLGIDAWPYSGRSNPMHLVAFCGQLRIAQRLCNSAMSLNAYDSTGRLPLYFALTSQSHAMSMWLMSQAQTGVLPPVLSPGVYREHMAATYGWDDVLRRLISEPGAIDRKEGQLERTPLLTAAANAHAACVQLLVQVGADVKHHDIDGNTALIAAVEFDDEKVWTLLLDANVDINAVNNAGDTALTYAIHANKLKLTRLLIDRGADPVIAFALHAAAMRNFVPMLETCAQVQLDIDMLDSTSHTALQVASHYGCYEAAEWLLRKGADPRRHSSVSSTALLLAIKGGHIDIVRMLLKRCTSEDLVDWRTSEGSTALHIAAHKGPRTIVELLLDAGAPVNAADFSPYQRTPLAEAVIEDQVDVIRSLLARSADGRIPMLETRCALDCAAEKSNVFVLEMLRASVVDINARNARGDTILHTACAYATLGFLKHLLRTFPDIDIDAEGYEGFTPLHGASDRGELPLVQLLLSRGSKVRPAQHGDLPMHTAAAAGHVEIVKIFATRDNVADRTHRGHIVMWHAITNSNIVLVKFLLGLGAALLCKGDDGRYAHFVALARGHLEVVEFLLECGLDYSVADDEDRNLLHYAAELEATSIISRLLQSTTAMSARDAMGTTPFLMAVRTGNEKIIDMFLAKDAGCVDDVNHFKVSALHLAAFGGHCRLVDRLLLLQSKPDVQDLHGYNAIHYAASRGHAAVIASLLKNNVPGNTLAHLQRTALFSATASRSMASVCQLLRAGGTSVMEVHDGAVGNTPLLEAASRQATSIVALLLDAGADRTSSNAFGMDLQDYARLYPSIKQILDDFGMNSPRVETRDPSAVLHATIVRTLAKLKSSASRHQIMRERERYTNILTLFTALTRLCHAARLTEAKILLIELVYNVDNVDYLFPNGCKMCGRSVRDFGGQICITCQDAWLCERCASALASRDASHAKRYKSYLAFEALERRLLPLRDAMQNMDHDMIGHAAMACAWHHDMRNWLQTIANDYQAWEEEHNPDDYFASLQRPGQEMLGLLRVAMERVRNIRDSVEETTAPLLEPAKKLYWLQQRYGADGVSVEFSCEQHEWLSVSATERESLCGDSTVFDERGRVTSAWLTALRSNVGYKKPIVSSSSEKCGKSLTLASTSDSINSEPTHQLTVARASRASWSAASVGPLHILRFADDGNHTTSILATADGLPSARLPPGVTTEYHLDICMSGMPSYVQWVTEVHHPIPRKNVERAAISSPKMRNLSVGAGDNSVTVRLEFVSSASALDHMLMAFGIRLMDAIFPGYASACVREHELEQTRQVERERRLAEMWRREDLENSQSEASQSGGELERFAAWGVTLL